MHVVHFMHDAVASTCSKGLTLIMKVSLTIPGGPAGPGGPATPGDP